MHSRLHHEYSLFTESVNKLRRKSFFWLDFALQSTAEFGWMHLEIFMDIQNWHGHAEFAWTHGGIWMDAQWLAGSGWLCLWLSLLALQPGDRYMRQVTCDMCQVTGDG